MNPEPDEFRDFPEPILIVNDDVAHPFSSPIQVQTIDQSLNDLPEESEEIKLIENDKQVQEYSFENETNHEDEEFLIDKNSFDIEKLNKIFHYLQIECERTQRITTHLENQLINVKNLGEKLSRFCHICRSLIISELNIHQNTSNMTSQELEMLTLYAPDIVNTNRLELINLLKQTTKLRMEIASLNEILIKSVLPKNERFYEIEQSLRLPLNLFSNENSFIYQIINKQNVYIRYLRGQFKQNDINIISTENPKHILAQINYNASEKYSTIFDIEFKRVITSRDQLTIALPCYSLPEQSKQQIYIRCKRLMDPLIYIPAMIEVYNDVSYAVFRMTQSLSAISVEAILFYPFETLRVSHNDSSSVYTSEHSSIFRIETPKNYFIRSPRVRIIPFNSELIRCMMALQREDQLLASSDLIEFDWYKEAKLEGMISMTIQLTRNFNLINENNEDLQKRRRKAQRKILSQRQKFEQEKYDEVGGSLAGTPTSTYGLTTPTVMSHLPSIAAIIERAMTDHQELRNKPSFSLNSSIKTPFKWKLDGFKNENAPIILLGYKNRKWKNCNNFVTITPTADKNTYIINSTILLDRIILIRCWSESNNEGKFDKLAENLWSLTSMKLFSCVLARDPSSINTLGHYALVIVPIQKQTFAEDILRKRNYTEFIYDEPFIYDNNSKTQLSKIIQYESHHTLLTRSSLRNTTKYVQFCLSEGTYVKIVPMGNIDVHEKVELNFRLHAQYPVVLEFDIYPIDIYRQKTDTDFIGTLNIYQINGYNLTLGSTSSILTAAAISSRTSSDSKDLEILDSSARTSISGPESISNSVGTIGRSGLVRDFNETNLVSAIRIRLPKIAFNFPSTQSNKIPIIVPDFFTNVVESLTEGKREFAQALNIHPALINPLVTSHTSQTRESDTSRANILKDENTKLEQNKLENETLLKWLKRQNAFKTNETIDNIVSALINIGRVDLAYIFKIDNLRNRCEDR